MNETPDRPDSDEEKRESKQALPEICDEVSVTKHSMSVNGRTLNYTATAGTMVLLEEKHAKDGEFEGNKQRARIFFVAYALDHEEAATRPVTFAYNGGPGPRAPPTVP